MSTTQITSRPTSPGSRRPARPSWSTCPTAKRSSCASRRSPSASGTPLCGCSPTTAPSPARRSKSARAPMHRRHREPRRRGGHRPLARPPTREPLRRYASDSRARSRSASAGGPQLPPDPGVYWYHPAHARGLRSGDGVVRQRPRSRRTWTTGPPTHRELALTLDDILLENGKVAPFSRSETTYAAMGRFGDVLLVNGETDLALEAKLGEVVRFYLTNTANTRFQGRPARGAHEARRRRQRPRRARADRGGRRRRAVRARCDRRALRDGRGARARAPHARTRLSARHRHGERTAGRAGARYSVRGFAHERRHGGRARADRRVSDAEADKTLAFIAEMDMGAPQGEGPCSHLPDAPTRGQRGARSLPRDG